MRRENAIWRVRKGRKINRSQSENSNYVDRRGWIKQSPGGFADNEKRFAAGDTTTIIIDLCCLFESRAEIKLNNPIICFNMGMGIKWLNSIHLLVGDGGYSNQLRHEQKIHVILSIYLPCFPCFKPCEKFRFKLIGIDLCSLVNYIAVEEGSCAPQNSSNSIQFIVMLSLWVNGPKIFPWLISDYCDGLNGILCEQPNWNDAECAIDLLGVNYLRWKYLRSIILDQSADTLNCLPN